MHAENIQDICDRVAAAAVRAGRAPEAVRLIAVSKTVEAARIVEATRCGLTRFGENYVQEAGEKIPVVRSSAAVPLEFHFIGHLQRNKAKDAVRLFDWVHSVDRGELGAALQKAAAAAGKRLPILAQVNTSGEESKSGISPERLESLLTELSGFPALDLRGLMCIGRYVEEAASDAERRREFRLLAQLRSEMVNRLGLELPELSMGMSHDFELAIEEGATFVRVGTALFGERTAKQ